MIQRLTSYLRFVKFEHTLFSLPLLYGGVFLAAEEAPSPRLLLLVLAAGVGARTSALALNRIIDRKIDALNPRTRGRELPGGRMSMLEAVLVLVAGTTVYLAAAWSIGLFCLKLAPIPLAVFAAYPYMKRFTSLSHLGVGLGLGMAPLGGWVAVRQSLDGLLPGAMLAVFTLLWVSGFDIIYATLDEESDRKLDLRSFVVRFGRERALKISGLFHLGSFLALAWIFAAHARSLPGLICLLVSGALLYLEHRKAEDVELAFFKINAAVGFAVFLLILSGVTFS